MPELPGAGLVELGRGITELALSVGGLVRRSPEAEAFEKAEVYGEVLQAKQLLIDRIDQFNLQFDPSNPQQPPSSEFLKLWDEAKTKMQEEAAGLVKLPEAKARLDEWWAGQYEKQQQYVIDLANDRFIVEKETQAITMSQDLVRQGKPEELEQTLQEAGVAGVLSANEVRSRIDKMIPEAQYNHVLNALLQGGDYEEALTLANAPGFGSENGLDADQMKSLLTDLNQRAGFLRDQAKRGLEKTQTDELDRLWDDFVGGKVHSIGEVVKNYQIDPDKYGFWNNLFDEIASKGRTPKSDPQAELEAYDIFASSESASEKANKIDELVRARRLTPDDGLKYRQKVKEYSLTPEQETAYGVLRETINFMIQGTENDAKKLEYAMLGSRAMEVFYGMVREKKPLQEIRQTVNDMMIGKLKNVLIDRGALGKMPEQLSEQEVHDLEAALEASGQRKPIPVEQKQEYLARIRSLEEKAIRANIASLKVVPADAIYSEEYGWVFTDKTLPRKPNGEIDQAAAAALGARLFRVQSIKKATGRFFEFYEYDGKGWRKIGWSGWTK